MLGDVFVVPGSFLPRGSAALINFPEVTFTVSNLAARLLLNVCGGMQVELSEVVCSRRLPSVSLSPVSRTY